MNIPKPKLDAPVTEILVDRALGLRFEDLTDDVRNLAVQCILDWFGVSIAGVNDEAVSILIEELREQGGRPEATVLWLGDRLPIRSAALANGTASHALDYDDVHFALPGHGTTAVFPAVLALSERLGASRSETITAFVAGYETACRVGLLIAPNHYDRGFHSTATIGTIGAAAGCARLLRLTPQQARCAISIAATQAAGLKASFGTMCKPLHAGAAASDGLFAALLARRGFTAVENVLEHRQGFAAAASDDFNHEAALADVPGGYHLRATLFKYHAACYMTHSTIENALQLVKQHAFSPDDIDIINLRVDRGMDKTCNIAVPKTGLEAKFSLRHVVALVLLGYDTARLDVFSDTVLQDKRLPSLRDRCRIEFTDGLPSTESHMAIQLKDGRCLLAHHDSGIPARDIIHQYQRLLTKFRTLVQPVLGKDKTESLVSMLASLDVQSNMRAVLEHATRNQ